MNCDSRLLSCHDLGRLIHCPPPYIESQINMRFGWLMKSTKPQTRVWRYYIDMFEGRMSLDHRDIANIFLEIKHHHSNWVHNTNSKLFILN